MANETEFQISNLPDWFSLKKYATTEQLDVSGWVRQIGPRYSCGICLTRGNLRGFWQRFLPLMKHGIYNPPFGEDDFPMFQLNPDLTPRWVTASVRSMALYEIGENLDDNLIMEMNRAAEKHDAKFLETPFNIYRHERDWVASDAWLIVDLNAADKQIIDDFQSWLKVIRELLNVKAPKTTFSENKFKQWTNSRVLPYIDLSLWSRAENVWIKDKLYGDILFPEEIDIDTTERIRKTTRPLARRLLTGTTLAALQLQAKTP